MKGDMNKQKMIEVMPPAANNPSGTFTPRRAGGTGRARNNDPDITL